MASGRLWLTAWATVGHHPLNGCSLDIVMAGDLLRREHLDCGEVGMRRWLHVAQRGWPQSRSFSPTSSHE
jgi:hypothetical protein